MTDTDQEYNQSIKTIKKAFAVAAGIGAFSGLLGGSLAIGISVGAGTLLFGITIGGFGAFGALFSNKDAKISQIRKSFASCVLIGACVGAPLEFLENYSDIRKNIFSASTTDNAVYEVAHKAPKSTHYTI